MNILPKLKQIANTNTLLWVALTLAMLGSLKHLATVFASIDGNVFLGWLQAIAIDAGLFALAYSFKRRKEQGGRVWFVVMGLVLFAAISGYANLHYALIATDTLPRLQAFFQIVKPFVLSATLPLLVLYLAELIASDNAKIAKPQSEKAQSAKVAQTDNREIAISKSANSLPKAEAVRIAKRLHSEAVPIAEIAEKVGKSQRTVYGYLNGNAKAGVK